MAASSTVRTVCFIIPILLSTIPFAPDYREAAYGFVKMLSKRDSSAVAEALEEFASELNKSFDGNRISNLRLTAKTHKPTL